MSTDNQVEGKSSSGLQGITLVPFISPSNSYGRAYKIHGTHRFPKSLVKFTGKEGLSHFQYIGGARDFDFPATITLKT